MLWYIHYVKLKQEYNHIYRSGKSALSAFAGPDVCKQKWSKQIIIRKKKKKICHNQSLVVTCSFSNWMLTKCNANSYGCPQLAVYAITGLRTTCSHQNYPSVRTLVMKSWMICGCMSKDWLADCQSHYMMLGPSFKKNIKERKREHFYV